MNRRRFLETAALAPLAAPQISSAAPSPNPRMKCGTQHNSTDEVLTICAALGVNHVCSTLPSRTFDAAWSVEGLTRLRERVESHGIVLGKSPERDREIENIQQMIRNAARAGIPELKYNMSILGVVRTGTTTGRGSARLSTFVYADAKQEPPLTEAGPVSDDQAWERITYFLERVIPVAAEYKVRMACHPHDPGMPRDKGFRGVHRVLGNVDGLKKFISIKENPYHGLNFCQGTVSEMLQNPNEEIHDVIRYFGMRKKIFNVHFRNIKGGFLNFRETFPDDGDVNMIRAIRTYKEVGYDGMLMPDHVPKIDGDDNGKQAFAFAFGYIQALIQMVYA